MVFKHVYIKPKFWWYILIWWHMINNFYKVVGPDLIGAHLLGTEKKEKLTLTRIIKLCFKWWEKKSLPKTR